MARLSERAQLVTDELFVSRVAMAAVTVALEVVIEDRELPLSPVRSNLASAILSNPLAQGARLTAIVIADSNIADLALDRNPTDVEITTLDTAIATRIRKAWNALSGVTGQDAVIQ